MHLTIKKVGSTWYSTEIDTIDIEATQWGWIYSDRLSLTVQPNSNQSAITYDSPYRNDTNVTYSTDQTSIPHVTGGIAMQMWLMNHQAPKNGKNAEMVLTNFNYTPN